LISTNEGLLHVVAESVADRIPWALLRRQRPAVNILHDRFLGGYWLGFRDGGLLYFRDGESYAEGSGLGRGWVGALRLAQDGAVWAATEGGLSRVKNGRIATLSSKNGLPCDSINWTEEDNDHCAPRRTTQA
jgi:ligand-binding sensor domain-containing protein